MSAGGLNIGVLRPTNGQGGIGGWRRMWRYMRPQRKRFALGLAAGFGMAITYAAGLGGILPVLKILVEPEGFHGWSDRTVAERRLGLGLKLPDPRRRGDGDGGAATVGVDVRHVKPGSPAEAAGFKVGDTLVAVPSHPGQTPLELLAVLARAPSESPLAIVAHRAGAAAEERVQLDVTPDPPQWYLSAWQRAAAALPRETTPAGQIKLLVIVLAGLLIVNILGNLMRFTAQYSILIAAHRTVMDLRRNMYSKALRLPMTHFSENFSETVSKFVQDAREVFLGIVTLFGKMAREPLKAACVLAVAIWVDWRLTLVALVLTPAAVALLWFFGRKVRRAMTRLLGGYARLLGSLEETFQGIPVVKAYAQEGRERRRLWHTERDMLGNIRKLSMIEAVSSPLIEVIGLLAASVGIVWLASRTLSGNITPSEFTTMVILLVALLDPIRKVASVYNGVQRAGAAATRIFDFLDQPEEGRALSSGEPLKPMRREVELVGVSYQYPTGRSPAVDDVSLTVRAGESVALVGPNGSGKTTLARLMLGLLEPSAGQIRIDGRDATTASLRSLRRQYALVTQTPVIFSRSVHENIAYGVPSATREEVERAARVAHADEFIRELPDGYDTVVGQYGATLSGGQRQRLAIARAVLQDAPILIFDEATSEVDSDSERKIHAALAELMQGRTTILIAHRSSVVRMAERIVVMEAGMVLDSGTHEELLGRCSLYRILMGPALGEHDAPAAPDLAAAERGT